VRLQSKQLRGSAERAADLGRQTAGGCSRNSPTPGTNGVLARGTGIAGLNFGRDPVSATLVGSMARHGVKGRNALVKALRGARVVRRLARSETFIGPLGATTRASGGRRSLPYSGRLEASARSPVEVSRNTASASSSAEPCSDDGQIQTIGKIGRKSGPDRTGDNRQSR